MSVPDYNSPVFALWRIHAGEHWREYTGHAFVKGLGDGSLPKASFIHYLIQDYVFLVHFSRAWAMAVVKSGSLEEMRTAAGTVDALVNHEMKLHVETCAREGITEDQLFSAVEARENMAYTRFVMDAGLSGDFLDLMAALAPCVFGYGEIGKALGKNAVSGTPYQEWIDTYSGTEYQALCDQVGQMLETAARARLGEEPLNNPRWSSLCARFENATRLEVGFWDMALRGTV
ncbi:MAG: thiaminase II [Pseudomonadota bacterium]